MEKKERIIFYLLAALTVSAGLWARFKDFPEWKEQDLRCFHDGRPLLTSFDGYFYLRYAADLLDSTYGEQDALRLAPHGLARPSPPPLLSWLTAFLSRISGIHIEWIAFLLPPLLSLSLVLPLWGIGYCLGGRWVALESSALALLAPAFVQRTTMGYFDTDGLVVTFSLLASLLPFLVVQSRGWQRWVYTLLLMVNAVLFWLWWDMAQHAVTAICLASVAVATLYAWKFSRKAVPFLLGAGATGLLLLLLVRGWRDLLHYPISAFGNLAYVLNTFDQELLALGSSVMEQARVPLFELFPRVSGHAILFGLSAAGLLAALRARPLPFVVLLLVPLLLGSLTFSAARFAIFLSPCMALGLAYGVERLATAAWARRPPWGRISAISAIGLAMATLIGHANALTIRPVITGYWAEYAASVRQNTPKDAIIWAWWDQGHALTYWSRRAVLADGGHPRDEVAAIVAAPLAGSDFRAAANWMHFYAVRGLDGMQRLNTFAGGREQAFLLLQEVMAGGPEALPDLLTRQGIDEDGLAPFFFPRKEERRPILLLLDQHLLLTCAWWFQAGTWHVREPNAGPPLLEFFGGVEQRGNRLICYPHFEFDILQGHFHSGSRRISLSRLLMKEPRALRPREYQRTGPVLQIDTRLGQAILCDTAIADSVFNKLYFLSLADDRYFRPIARRGMQVQYWEVVGDVPLL